MQEFIDSLVQEQLDGLSVLASPTFAASTQKMNNHIDRLYLMFAERLGVGNPFPLVPSVVIGFLRTLESGGYRVIPYKRVQLQLLKDSTGSEHDLL